MNASWNDWQGPLVVAALAGAVAIFIVVYRHRVGVTSAEEPQSTDGRSLGQITQPLPTEIEVVPGKLTIQIDATDFKTMLDGTIRCWSYRSRGFSRIGQKEIAFYVKQTSGELDREFPRDLLNFYGLIYQRAEQGRLVDLGDFSILNPEHHGLLGRFHGVMYVPSVSTETEPQDITGVLLTRKEVEAVQRFGVLRLMGTLGWRTRFFPTAVWADRERAELPTTDAGDERSLLPRLPLGRVPGLWAEVVSDEAVMEPVKNPKVAGDELVNSFRGARLVLNLPENARSWFQNELPKLKNNLVALIADPNPNAQASFAWDPGEKQRQIIGYAGHGGRKIAGSFVILFEDKEEKQSLTRMREDGFAIGLTPDDWRSVREALLGSRSLSLETAGATATLDIQWRRSQGEKSDKGFNVVNLALYQGQDVLEQRVHVEPLSAFVKQLEGICENFFANDTTPQALNIVVVIKPGKRFRVWFVPSVEAVGARPFDALRMELEEAQAPEVVGGPVAVAIMAAAGGAERRVPDPKSFQPPMPEEWKDAASRAGRPVLILDDIMDAVWPEAH